MPWMPEVFSAPAEEAWCAQALRAEASPNINDVMIPGKTARGIIEGDSVLEVFIPG